jgi:hypothetical protein
MQLEPATGQMVSWPADKSGLSFLLLPAPDLMRDIGKADAVSGYAHLESVLGMLVWV